MKTKAKRRRGRIVALELVANSAADYLALAALAGQFGAQRGDVRRAVVIPGAVAPFKRDRILRHLRDFGGPLSAYQIDDALELGNVHATRARLSELIAAGAVEQASMQTDGTYATYRATHDAANPAPPCPAPLAAARLQFAKDCRP